MKRLFDITVSVIAILVLMPLWIVLSILIMVDSTGGVVYRQERIGRNGKPFLIVKFRTMTVDADNFNQLLTVGDQDIRITRVGYYLRKFKLDELPQLINVLKGEMSLVGPRPEVAKYVNQYNSQQRKVFTVKPGITDYASIKYANENELLEQYDDPEKAYIQQIMPDKLHLNLLYIENHGMLTDLKILIKTLFKLLYSSGSKVS